MFDTIYLPFLELMLMWYLKGSGRDAILNFEVADAESSQVAKGHRYQVNLKLKYASVWRGST